MMLKPPSDVVWIPNRHHILIVHGETASQIFGAERYLWEMLCLGRELHHLMSPLEQIYDIQDPSDFTTEAFRAWQAAGILEEVGDGESGD